MWKKRIQARPRKAALGRAAMMFAPMAQMMFCLRQNDALRCNMMLFPSGTDEGYKKGKTAGAEAALLTTRGNDVCADGANDVLPPAK